MGLGDYLQLFFLLILFIAVLFGAYYSTKMLGKFQSKKTMGKNIKVIESIMIGPQKYIQLIKVGEEFLLIGVTKDHITFLRSMNEDQLTFSDEDFNESQNIPFSKVLEKLTKKK